MKNEQNNYPPPRTQNRIEYIDILKGFTIIWVLWMHMDLPELIYPSVQMPVFFFISGTFYRAKVATLWAQMCGDARRLLVPAASFMALVAVLMIIRGDDLWTWNVVQVVHKLRNGSITWFLIALFGFRTINYVIERYKKGWWYVVLMAVVYPIGFLWKVKFPEIETPVIPVQEMFMFGIYYALGYCIGKRVLGFLEMKQEWGQCVIVALCVVYVLTVHVLDWESGLLGKVPWLVYGFPYTLACIYLGLCVSRLVEGIAIVSKPLGYFGRNSIVFYLTHWVLWIFVFRPLGWNLYIVFAIITLLEFPVIYLITTYVPWMAGQNKTR